MRKFVIMLVICVSIGNVSFAQSDPEDPGGTPDTNDMPLDNGVMLLAMTAAGLAAIKKHKKVKNEKIRSYDLRYKAGS